jgi:hypothetical protein
MPDFIYCGTARYVDAIHTKQLLIGNFNAIWSPPHHMQNPPNVNDRVWLVWRQNNQAIPVVLGGGSVLAVPNGEYSGQTQHFQA